MIAIRNFVMVCAGIGLAWLLWRVNAAIGSQAILLVFGVLAGMIAAIPVAIVVVVLGERRQPQQSPAQPQAPQWQPPVIVLLGDGQRNAAARYAAPAGLFAQSVSREVGERGEWVDGESWGGRS